MDIQERCIEAETVSKQFGKTTALSGISFRINAGECVGLLGPNGAGKSTLIRILSGILSPGSGKIILQGKIRKPEDPSWKRYIGTVLEELALFDYLTIGENIFFLGRLYGLSTGEAEKRRDELLSFLGLHQYRDTLLREASQGMKKKTALALSLIHNPDVLLLDEVFTGIDTLSAANIRALLGEMIKKGKTVMISSHIINSIISLITRIIIIDKGKIILDSDTADLQRNGDTIEEIYLNSIYGRDRERSRPEWLL